MIRAIRLASILVLCSLAIGSVQAQQRLGVVVQSATYDPVKHEVDVRFYNSSKHDVTAYNYSLRMDYADGTSRVEDRGTEFQVSQEFGNYLFLAGATKDQTIPEPPQSKTVTRVVGTVDVVVYDDRTAEVVNEAAFNRLIARRSATARAVQKIEDILEQALSATDPPAAALTELDNLRKTYAAKEGLKNTEDGAMEHQLRSTIANLNRLRGGKSLTLEQLKAYIAHLERESNAVNLHSQVRRLS